MVSLNTQTSKSNIDEVAQILNLSKMQTYHLSRNVGIDATKLSAKGSPLYFEEVQIKELKLALRLKNEKFSYSDIRKILEIIREKDYQDTVLVSEETSELQVMTVKDFEKYFQVLMLSQKPVKLTPVLFTE